MWRRASIGKRGFAWWVRAGVRSRLVVMTLFCGVIAAAAGGVRLFDGRQQTAGGPTRDAQLMQLNDMDYLPGPRCLD